MIFSASRFFIDLNLCPIQMNIDGLTDTDRIRGQYIQLTDQASFRLDERSILSVHLVIEPARVAQIMPGAVSAPQRCRRRTAVDTLATLWQHKPTIVIISYLLAQTGQSQIADFAPSRCCIPMNSVKRCSCPTSRWYHHLENLFKTQRRALFFNFHLPHENMTSSSKPEVHNVLQHCQRRIQPRPQTTCTKIWWNSVTWFSSYAVVSCAIYCM